jgi:hypothetical protein
MHEQRTRLTVLLGQVQLLRRRHTTGRALPTLGRDLAIIGVAAVELAGVVVRAKDRQPSDPQPAAGSSSRDAQPSAPVAAFGASQVPATTPSK